jgi:hypothetical protein
MQRIQFVTKLEGRIRFIYKSMQLCHRIDVADTNRHSATVDLPGLLVGGYEMSVTLMFLLVRIVGGQVGKKRKSKEKKKSSQRAAIGE